jgi:CelD/BcsL family acetyltransferase involved in cellulose biosynthesis
MSPTLEVVAGPDGFGEPARWNALVASAPGGSFFQTAQWCTSWWEELAGKPELAVARVTDDGRLLAAGALALTRIPVMRRIPIDVRVVVNAGTGVGAADHCGFPVDAAAGLGTLDLLWDWALHWRGDRPLLLANLDPCTTIAARVADTLEVVDEERCPTAVVGEGQSFDDVLAGWTKNRRKTIGKKLRDFEGAGGRFEWIDEPQHVVELLPAVFRLHHARRSAVAGPTSFGGGPASRAFHARLASYADASSGCWVQLSRVGTEVVGALYGFRFTGTYSVYQSGWDAAWGESSLGLIQYAEAFRNAVEHGATTFDMCRGADAYKLRFATETRVERSYARLSGLGGALLRARWAARRVRRRQPAEQSGQPRSERP